MDPQRQRRLTRRAFLSGTSAGLGSLALAALTGPARGEGTAHGGLPGLPHFAARAKRVVWIFPSGGASQIDLFDDKEVLRQRQGETLPESVRRGQRLTTMTANLQKLFLAGSPFTFSRYGASGAQISELLPHLGQVADHLCIVRSFYGQAINHDPAMTFVQTGAELPGRPTAGAWASYGLGRESDEFPAFVVLAARCTTPEAQPLYGRAWSSGFLPAVHQGVPLRSGGDPVLFLDEGAHLPAAHQAALARRLRELDTLHHDTTLDPALEAKIASHELAFRLQTAVPELADLSQEPESTFTLYGEDARVPGTHARNCLLARRLLERGVRWVQLFHRDWDHHNDGANRLRNVGREIDQGSAALVADLHQRGLLEDTLVIFASEFGRTAYVQGAVTPTFGRDHHPRCWSGWLAGGGIKPGITYGRTDDFSYNVEEDPVSIHDLHATILHLLGIDHLRLTYRHLGRDFRLTDVAGQIVTRILA